MYAVIETGGKQYRVRNKEIISVEKLDADAGSEVTFDRVLAVSNGTELIVGTPTVEGASITGVVMEQYRDKKVVAFKFNDEGIVESVEGGRDRVDEIGRAGLRNQGDPLQRGLPGHRRQPVST